MPDSKPSQRLSLIEKQLPGGAPAYNTMASAQASPPARPAYSSLPLDKNGPSRNCWSLFGADDELGQLNYITPEVTRAASKEIEHGIKIGLDLPLDFFDPPSFSRVALKHDLISLGEHGTAHDDVVHFNPQSSTQWDGFRHVGSFAKKLFYNGTTAEQIRSSNRIGTDAHIFPAWCKAGGFATRGVLLDFRRWADAQGQTKPPFERTPITLSDLQQVAASQGVTLRTGDVLMVRSGYLKDYPMLSTQARAERHARGDPPCIGLEQSDELIRWVWESGVIAVAGDHPTLEAWPWPQGSENVLHENFLAGWGMPIGEYFDLERLSQECARVGKWTFFFTSIPLHVPGGVGAPVNGIAVL